VRFWNDSNPAPKQFTMRYDFYGKNLSLADPFVHDFFDDEIYPFADAGTYSPPFEGWQCRYDPEEQLFLKKKLKDGLTYIICHFYYMEGRLIKADVKHNALAGIQKKLEYRLEPDYNAAGLLTGRRLFHNKDLVWVDNITYRLNGMPDKIQRFKFTNGLQTALFEIKNEYYSDTDLPAPEH
jgi:hypothetical protein